MPPVASTRPPGAFTAADEREIAYDLLVVVPVHGGAEYLARSGDLSDPLGFIPADRHTLQSRAAPNIFAIGDAVDVPTSKAGSVTHFEGEIVVENIRRFLEGDELTGRYDGHANCFIETGFRRALLIDFDYETEPLPGRFPDRRLGPLPLLAESRLNHLAKLAFQPLYWHVLLPGHDIPGVSSEFHSPTVAPATQQSGGLPSSTVTLAGSTVEVDSEGFLVDPQQWNEQMATEIASENGIEQLTDRHWQVINFMRKTYLESGSGPSIRSLGETSGVPIKELYELFPKGPAKLAAKIGGIPKPRGCI